MKRTIEYYKDAISSLADDAVKEGVMDKNMNNRIHEALLIESVDSDNSKIMELQAKRSTRENTNNRNQLICERFDVYAKQSFLADYSSMNKICMKLSEDFLLDKSQIYRILAKNNKKI